MYPEEIYSGQSNFTFKNRYVLHTRKTFGQYIKIP